ncbi:MAG TPA: sugar transferase [Solirubrobacteraceae bacterium]|nr:sugar transferase [Solirubrobacteraceae bacterium]
MSDSTLTYEQALEAAATTAEQPIGSRATHVACRALDVVAAALALVVLAPLLLVIAACIRMDSRGPALFRQERRGRDMRPFVVNKFRTMHVNAPNDEHVAYVQSLIAGDAERKQQLFKLVADDRVTRAGRLLRKSSLDELPQLINVLLGNMSLVGPRPCLDYELEKYPAHAYGRFAVKPGITGLWQVSGRSQLSFDEMIALDLEYAQRRSLWLNLTILLRTLPVVLLGRGAA